MAVYNKINIDFSYTAYLQKYHVLIVFKVKSFSCPLVGYYLGISMMWFEFFFLAIY